MRVPKWCAGFGRVYCQYCFVTVGYERCPYCVPYGVYLKIGEFPEVTE